MLLLLGGALMLVVAGTLALSVVGALSVERAAVGRSVALVHALDAAPDALRGEVQRPFNERVLAPLGDRLVGIGRRVVRAGTAERLQRRLDVAGNPAGWDVSRLIGTKVLGAAVLALLALAWAWSGGRSPLAVLLVAASAGSFGYVLPNVLLHNAGQKREALMQRELPDSMDLLTISVEAGLGFDAAVHRVAQQTTGPLSQELQRLIQEMQLGVGRTEAMRAMAERTTLPDLRSFCLAMVQADQLGVPVGRVLRIQSREMRVKRRQRAEEKAMKVPVKITVPLVLFILPCLFIIVLGPAGMSMAKIFA
ncbi:tight adherence protein C [Nocardioides salarius]|uniref:Tight adherence protein C n=1 Tax=Nocardioides salarius TaxID=374513 RepID=A0ABS2MF25_9ACTN|nr:type II secretion system F family protein [Nocardioides salarius]MBM7509781.1 tight adherence protein C [Nocardioides salarius]